MTAATCKTCPWWSKFPDRVEYEQVAPDGPTVEQRTEAKAGECRVVHPSHAWMDVADVMGRVFAVTQDADWCGEHPDRCQQARPAITADDMRRIASEVLLEWSQMVRRMRMVGPR